VCKKIHFKNGENATETFNIMKEAFKEQQTIKNNTSSE
jgi:hypothetical protein